MALFVKSQLLKYTGWLGHLAAPLSICHQAETDPEWAGLEVRWRWLDFQDFTPLIVLSIGPNHLMPIRNVQHLVPAHRASERDACRKTHAIHLFEMKRKIGEGERTRRRPAVTMRKEDAPPLGAAARPSTNQRGGD